MDQYKHVVVDISKVPDCAVKSFCEDTITMLKKKGRLSKKTVIREIKIDKNKPCIAKIFIELESKK